MLHFLKVMSNIPIYKALVVLGVVLVSRTEDQVDWRVVNKIEQYGGNLTLICTFNKTLENHEDTVSKRWYKGHKLCSLNNQTTDKTKYKAVVDTDSVNLTIINFTEEDINHSYHCEIGFYTSEMKVLSLGSVFKDKKISSEDDASEKDGNSTVIISVILVCSFLVLSFVVLMKRFGYKRFCKDESPSVGNQDNCSDFAEEMVGLKANNCAENIGDQDQGCKDEARCFSFEKLLGFKKKGENPSKDIVISQTIVINDDVLNDN